MADLRRRARRSGAGHAEQHAAFAHLTRRMATCVYGRENGIKAGMTYDEFRRQVALRQYEGFVPFIERIQRGERDILWPGGCRYFAVSSGTTAGRTKYLPVTGALSEHFRRAGLEALLWYAARTGRADVFLGRHLFLGGSTALTPLPARVNGEPAWAGDLSGITALDLPAWAEQGLYEPGRKIAQMTDWPAKIAAIAERTLRRDITLLAGIPSWVLVLAGTLRARAAQAARPVRHLQELWPNLQCLVHGGVPVAPFAAELQAALGPAVAFHEVYPASEGFIAAQDAGDTAGLRLLTGTGLFFEFLPFDGYAETDLPELGRGALPLEAVKIGVDYVLLLTTPAGLCRYVIGDVVRFTTTDVPRIVYAGRTKLQLSAFGEHVIEKELTDALAVVARSRGWQVADFHVAPFFVDAAAGVRRGRHEWWLELRSTAGGIPAAEEIAVELDRELMLRNDDYEAKRRGGGLEPPLVRCVAQGTFERWLRAGGHWGGSTRRPAAAAIARWPTPSRPSRRKRGHAGRCRIGTGPSPDSQRAGLRCSPMNPTVLIVDDERDVLDLIQHHLSRAGCEVIRATSGREALEHIRIHRPDLVLLDLMLPDIDGFAVCEILHRQAATAAIPIVIVSAWATDDSHNLGLELGALDYVTKPFSPKALAERVRNLLNKRAEAEPAKHDA